MELIDSFDHRRYPPAKIPINDKMREKWDLEENQGFHWGYTPNGNRYKIRSGLGGEAKVLRYLELIHEYIYTLKGVILANPYLCENCGCTNEALLFVVTPCTLQEIPEGTDFEGINKPKNIVSYPSGKKIFHKDNNYRAGGRHIMLSLRNKSGGLRSWTSVKRLLLHELAHTLCNHCTYRESGNHEKKDFGKCESFLGRITSGSVELQGLESQIRRELFSH